ncbi:MAG: GNAT family N-acetyltransferase [Solirubrobacterales bacterium]|nr:GNAT family N-acetyltransferase [Solirubrobacterales bacterium]
MACEPQISFTDAAFHAGPGADLLQAMRDELRGLYDGLDVDDPSMPRAGAAELAPPHGAIRVGRIDGELVCVGAIKRLDEQTCELKRMYIVPVWRGRGVLRRLLHELEDTARRLGYTVARLDTGPRQSRAQWLYEHEGYRAIENFNGNPVACFWGEKPLR